MSPFLSFLQEMNQRFSSIVYLCESSFGQLTCLGINEWMERQTLSKFSQELLFFVKRWFVPGQLWKQSHNLISGAHSGLLAKETFLVESGWQLLYLRVPHLCATPSIRDWTVKINKAEVGRTRESGLKGLGEKLVSSKTGKERYACTLGSRGGPVPREPRQACPGDSYRTSR